MKKLFNQVVAIANEPNQNNRIYTREVLQEICDDNKDLINNRSMFGIIGFPEDSIIYFSEVSHIVTRLTLCLDNELVADIEICDSPHGKLLQNIIDAGVKVSFRICGVGAVDTRQDGVSVIQSNFKLISICAVPTDKAA